MLAGATGVRWCVLGTILAFTFPAGAHVAEARTFHSANHWRHAASFRTRFAGHGGIQCVAFAREATGMALKGNAAIWWNAADGRYARGNVPETGSILSFRASGRMRLGHVAVVHDVVTSREIEIDHAHWGGGGVYRSVSVIDVSPDNDWTAVRVALAHGGTYGSIYPTNGFIYDRAPGTAGPAAQVLPAVTPLPDLNPPPRDLPTGRRGRHGPLPTYDEVAELPARGHLDLNVAKLHPDTPTPGLH